jgi:hypothetical protein
MSIFYPGTDITHAELFGLMRQAYDEIIAFISDERFRSTVDELYKLPPEARPSFVRVVFLDPLELEKRGIKVPPNLKILRSAFGDRRPTLFCVKRWLPTRYHKIWQNCNVTFDNDFADTGVPRDERAWRRPLPADVQAILIEAGVSAGEVKGLDNAQALL